MGIDKTFWKNRSVFLTGHTGFKGGWLALWLADMGAKVNGYALEASACPSFFTETNLRERLYSTTIGDIANLSTLKSAISLAKPSVVVNMAAQPLVRESYYNPIKTFETNVIGTVNLLEAARESNTIEAIINVTTDKCYQNKEQLKPYVENDKLGGYDPYSSSKACAELVTASYRDSFLRESGIKIATVRSGNVIGGGDWSMDRLIPDFLRTIDNKEKLLVRYPNAIRPWQHVLEPLRGYLVLAQKLISDDDNYSEAWNFGPDKSDSKSVSWVLNFLSQKIPNVKWEADHSKKLHEANLLFLDSSKARSKLEWVPKWSLEIALNKTIEWYQAWRNKQSMSEVSISQIDSYCKD